MKKSILIPFMLLSALVANSQDQRMQRENRLTQIKKIQAMEMAFITKELNLSPGEAQKFWPVFNQYRNELRSVASEKKMGDHLEKQQKTLDIRKKYREDFSKVMNQERANKVFGAEEEFKSLVRREFQKKTNRKKTKRTQKKRILINKFL